MTNQWIAPALVNLEPMQAKNMIVKRPHFRARPSGDRVIKSTASRQLFSTVRSSEDAKPLTLDEMAAAIYPDCRNSVALRYSLAVVQPEYEPYADVNVFHSTDTAGIRDVVFCDIIDYAKQFTNTSAFVPPSYSPQDIQVIEQQTKLQSESSLWCAMRKGRISASIAH